MTIQAAYAACESYDPKILRPALEKVLAPQLEPFGGTLRGRSVLLKPNLLAWRREGDIASIHPSFLIEAAKLFIDAGAVRVSLRETPGCQSVESVLHGMKIEETLHHLGIDYAGFADYRKVEPMEKMFFHDLELASEYQKFDCVADLAKVKTHGMMALTLCVKNLFGMVRGSSRLGWHLAVKKDFGRFAEMLLDLYLAVNPKINLLDGVIGMEGNGPGSGTPRNFGFVAGASDALGMDLSAARLLGVPDLLLLRKAADRHILPDEVIETGELPKLDRPIVLPDPPGICLDWGVFLPPFCRDFLRDRLLSRPVLDTSKCIGCGLCVKMCPPKSLKMRTDKRPVFDLKTCIRCYCCQEHCPQGAIRPFEPAGVRCLARIEKIMRKLF